MKTWEVIQELTVNPHKVFALKKENSIQLKVYNKTIALDHIDFIYLDDEWEEVQQPVPWHRAIQAWIDGKGFSIEMPKNRSIHQLRYNPLGTQLKVQSNDTNEQIVGLLPAHFSTGKWYIED